METFTRTAGLKPLAGLTTISLAQQQVVDHLWNMTGLCGGCRSTIRGTDAKLAAGTINSSYCANPAFRNTVGIVIYCARCAQAIDALLKGLKPKETNGNGNHL